MALARLHKYLVIPESGGAFQGLATVTGGRTTDVGAPMSVLLRNLSDFEAEQSRWSVEWVKSMTLGEGPYSTRLVGRSSKEM